jgi:hypothetical protein
MNPSLIPLYRLASQQLSGTKFTSPKEIVSWMGAMQAQDFSMAKWAIGVRLPGSTARMVEEAFKNGQILRTHLLRSTWHFVTPEDICWLLDLTAPQIKAGQSARDKQLGLTEAVYSRSNATIENALRQSGSLTREDLVAELQRAGIATDQNRASHLFARAELDKIICSGDIQRGKPMYALLDERVSNIRTLTREEALAELARRYFTSRCPATLRDFTWWSGLSAPDAKRALELVKSEFISEDVNGLTYWLAPDLTLPQPDKLNAQLLATYDEFIIAYANRTASIPVELERHMKQISDRGIFWPFILRNGLVVGTWRRTIKKDRLLVELKPFSPLRSPTLALLEQAAADFARFLNMELEFGR